MAILRRLLIGIGVLPAILVAVFLIWLGVNHVDADPTPATRSFLAEPPNPCPRDGNAYVAMIGFEAPAGTSVLQDGQGAIDDYDRRLDGLLRDPDAVPYSASKRPGQRLAYSGADARASLVDASIWALTRADPTGVAAALASNRELYERYRAAHAFECYFESARPSPFEPVASFPHAIRFLFLSDVALRLQSGTPAERTEALSDLGRDLRLGRTILHGSGGIVSKLLAASMIHSDLLLLSDFIADPSSDVGNLEAALGDSFAPFDVADWRIGGAFAPEFRSTSAALAPIPEGNYVPAAGSRRQPLSWAERSWNVLLVQFFKLNATENLMAERTERAIRLADGDPATFSAASRDYHRWDDARASLASVGVLYNPVGKVLFSISSSHPERFIGRVYDVAALQRLVYLSYQVRKQGIADADVPEFMRAHPGWATHPVDRAPCRWDRETRTLAVVPVGASAAKVHFTIALAPNGGPRAHGGL